MYSLESTLWIHNYMIHWQYRQRNNTLLYLVTSSWSSKLLVYQNQQLREIGKLYFLQCTSSTHGLSNASVLWKFFSQTVKNCWQGSVLQTIQYILENYRKCSYLVHTEVCSTLSLTSFCDMLWQQRLDPIKPAYCDWSNLQPMPLTLTEVDVCCKIITEE